MTKTAVGADDDFNEAFLKIITDLIVEMLSIDASKVTPDATFGDDLEADSLDLVEFSMAVEEQFDISIDEEELVGVKTLRDLLRLIQSKLDM